MLLIDRYIIIRFLLNFVILFSLLFMFAISVDLILQLDRFVDAARRDAGDEAGMLAVAWRFIGIVVDFHGPRVFQFYAYLMGLVAIGAMAFTLSQMHKYKELVAVMASGVSLHRLAMPFMVAATGLNALQLINQEFVLPEVAPQLIRKHGDIGEESIEAFKVNFTRDGQNTLFHAALFDPATRTLDRLTLHERDERGRTVRRIEADSAEWDEAAGVWRLENGRAVQPDAETAVTATSSAAEPIETYESTVTPDILTMRRYRQYTAMLSMRQIDEMLNTPGMIEDAPMLARHKFSRFSAIFVNLMVFYICLPFFLLREPANLVRQALLCAAVAIPAMLGALIGMTVPLEGIPPAVGVFLAPIIFLPVVLARYTTIRT